MARLSKKIPNDLNELDHTWISRDDFIATVLDDPNFISNIRLMLPNEELATSLKNLSKHMFMPTGWQLTKFGCKLLMRSYNSYRIAGPTKDALTGRQILKLNQLINGPWYLTSAAIYVWKKEFNFELHLFDANLDQYINTYFPKSY